MGRAPFGRKGCFRQLEYKGLLLCDDFCSHCSTYADKGRTTLVNLFNGDPSKMPCSLLDDVSNAGVANEQSAKRRSR